MAVNGIFIPDRNNQIPERVYQIAEAFGINQITAGVRTAFMPPDKGKDNKVERTSFEK